MGRLDGRVVLVTGGCKGIGRAIAKAMLRDGARVAVTYRRDEAAARIATQQLSDLGGNVVAIRGDHGRAAEIARIFCEVQDSLGRVNVLVNNAGRASFGTLAEVAAQEFTDVFHANYLAPLLCIQEFLKSAAPNDSIINISTAGVGPAAATTGIYTSSKAALNQLTRVLANELGARQIRVNAIAPGATDTEGFRARQRADSDLVHGIVKITPLGRLGTPEDIGSVASFLASDDARWITGEIITAAGGRH